MTKQGQQSQGDEASSSFSSPTRKLAIGLGRAFGGALIFALPMLMTMELWWFGFTMDRYRLVLLLLLMVPLLVGLAHRVGFEETFDWREDIRDAGIAYGVGILASTLILSIFDVLNPSMSVDELVGKIAVQSVPAAIGALLGRSQLGQSDKDREDEEDDGDGPLSGYGGVLFMMAIGALFLSLNVAPTDEMLLIGFKMSPWHALALVAVSIAVMHAFVYAVAFKGGSGPSSATPWWGDFVRFTLPGYMLALAISCYVLWTFGRTEDVGLMSIIMTTLVLALPASVGAAAARLIL